MRETVEIGGAKEEKRERERMKREEGGPREMKRERMKKDVDKNVAVGITKPSTSAGMLT